MRRYNPKEIEAKWRQVWRDTDLYKTPKNPKNEPYYCLVMFPYPSGNMHVGHWYNFGPADTIARYNRMKGKDVLHPFGYDSFGLPAENAAIKHGVDPAKWTKQNIADMTKQAETIGTMYDWDKMIATSDPDYYKWTQWLFLKLYEKGLAYRKKAMVNWCPKDQTVLANEQVIGDDNVCERCDTPVVQKDLEQWYFKITEYADHLLDNLENIDWPERVKTMQANWIGRSKGAEIDFAVEGSTEALRVFTTRADTLFGATYMVLAPEHPLLDSIVSEAQAKAISEYRAAAARKTELERKSDDKSKAGVFTGAYAINPVNDEKIPIWISDYVLMTYGTGAIMAVPAHDERDFAFAREHDLPIIPVVDTGAGEADGPVSEATAGEGTMINSSEYDGLRSAEARERIVADLAGRGIGEETTNYRLRDWLVSRQRYWGPPIPMLYCDDCGVVPVPEDQLPVALPEDVAFEPTGQSPLVQDESFVMADCPNCDGKATRETDTLDTFVDSSWYFLRYPNTKYDDGPYDPEAVKTWMPVDHYIGGIEHAILHLLYSRFITKVLHDHEGLPFEEPFKKLSNQGMILGPDGLKMSKSKGNVVDPDDQVGSYGSDSLRLYLMFMGPYDQGGPYDFGGIAGVRRFIERVWDLAGRLIDSAELDAADTQVADIDATKEAAIVAATHRTIRKVTDDLERMAFNTAIAAMMELVNTLNKTAADYPVSAQSAAWREAIESLVRILAPFAPHVSEELWSDLHKDKSVHLQLWPKWDEDLIAEEMSEIVVQVNGKVRATVLVASDAAEADVVLAAKTSKISETYLKDTQIVKTIYVPGRLINFVVR